MSGTIETSVSSQTRALVPLSDAVMRQAQERFVLQPFTTDGDPLTLFDAAAAVVNEQESGFIAYCNIMREIPSFAGVSENKLRELYDGPLIDRPKRIEANFFNTLSRAGWLESRITKQYPVFSAIDHSRYAQRSAGSTDL